MNLARSKQIYHLYLSGCKWICNLCKNDKSFLFLFLLLSLNTYLIMELFRCTCNSGTISNKHSGRLRSVQTGASFANNPVRSGGMMARGLDSVYSRRKHYSNRRPFRRTDERMSERANRQTNIYLDCLLDGNSIKYDEWWLLGFCCLMKMVQRNIPPVFAPSAANAQRQLPISISQFCSKHQQ